MTQKKVFEELRLKDLIINELKQQVQKLDRRINELETWKRIKAKVFYSLCTLVLTLPLVYMFVVWGPVPDAFKTYRADIQFTSFLGYLLIISIGVVGPVMVSLRIWMKD